MQPSPIAETSRPLFPSLRFFIRFSCKLLPSFSGYGRLLSKRYADPSDCLSISLALLPCTQIARPASLRRPRSRARRGRPIRFPRRDELNGNILDKRAEPVGDLLHSRLFRNGVSQND